MSENKIKKTYRNICSIEIIAKELKSANEDILTKINALSRQINNLKEEINTIRSNTYDLIYANLFHDTIKQSEWFNLPLSLGGWAIGYNFAYILYKALDEVRPQKILELGLGQSTKIINEYAKHFSAEHHIVEHDPDWVDFFKRSTDISKMGNIHLLECHKNIILI